MSQFNHSPILKDILVVSTVAIMNKISVITVFSVIGVDSDWLMGERGNQKGWVPITYLELLN